MAGKFSLVCTSWLTHIPVFFTANNKEHYCKRKNGSSESPAIILAPSLEFCCEDQIIIESES
jgi:hypothetical protein